MAKGKKISEQPIADSLQGDELIPFAKNGGNATVTPETIKEFTNEGLEKKYATIERVNDQLDGFAPKSWLASTDQEVSRINDALISGLNDKVDKVDGKGLSTNDFTDADKSKLDGIEDGAQVNPTKVSELQNDSKYQTESEVDAKIAEYAEDLQDVLDDKVDKVVGKELSTNDYTDSDKAKLTALPTNAELTATLGTKADKSTTYTKTETDNHIENRVAILSEVWDAQLEDSYNSLNNNKVDKVNGKQLSTEDFTTALKQKLEGLTNYNDEELSGKIDELKTALDVILNSEDTNSVIDTWEEVKNFLASVTNEQTLAGMLLDLRNDIVALCADTYLPLTGGTIQSKHLNTPLILDATETPSNECGMYYKIDGENKLWIGYSTSKGVVITNAVTQKRLVLNNDGSVYYDDKRIVSANGTSSQFLKADGSVDGTAYLPTASYTASDVLDKVKSVDGSGSGLDADKLDGKQPADLNVGSADKLTTKQLTNEDLNDFKSAFNVYFGDGGNTCLNKPSQVNAFNLQVIRTHETNRVQILTTVDGTIYKRYWNNTTWSSWQQLATTDGAVAKLTTKQLTNEDLNTIKDVNFSSYFAESSNTCANKPNGITAFGLIVQRYSTGLLVQILFSGDSMYKRRWNATTWSAWKRMLTEDDVTKVVSVSEVPSTPSANTLYVIPE